MLQSHYSLKDGSWCSQATLCDCVTVWLRDAVTVWLWAVAWTMERNKKYLSVIRFITQTCLLCVTCSSMKQILIAPVQVRLMTWRILTLFITSMFVCNSGDPGAPLVSTQPGNTEPLHNADTHWWRCVFECDYIWLFFPTSIPPDCGWGTFHSPGLWQWASVSLCGWRGRPWLPACWTAPSSLQRHHLLPRSTDWGGPSRSLGWNKTWGARANRTHE